MRLGLLRLFGVMHARQWPMRGWGRRKEEEKERRRRKAREEEFAEVSSETGCSMLGILSMFLCVRKCVCVCVCVCVSRERERLKLGVVLSRFVHPPLLLCACSFLSLLWAHATLTFEGKAGQRHCVVRQARRVGANEALRPARAAHAQRPPSRFASLLCARVGAGRAVGRGATVADGDATHALRSWKEKEKEEEEETGEAEGVVGRAKGRHWRHSQSHFVGRMEKRGGRRERIRRRRKGEKRGKETSLSDREREREKTIRPKADWATAFGLSALSLHGKEERACRIRCYSGIARWS